MIIINRVKGQADKFRAYKILLDGTQIGKIRQGESKQFPVQQGPHTLQLRLDWCCSKPLTFDLENEPITFECGSQPIAYFSAFAFPKDYMWLKRLEEPSKALP